MIKGITRNGELRRFVDEQSAIKASCVGVIKYDYGTYYIRPVNDGKIGEFKIVEQSDRFGNRIELADKNGEIRTCYIEELTKLLYYRSWSTLEEDNLIKIVGLYLKKKARISELRRAYKEVMAKR